MKTAILAALLALAVRAGAQVVVSEIDANRRVVNVLAVDSSRAKLSGRFDEPTMFAYLRSIYGPQRTFVRTVYGDTARGFGAIGTVYDPIRNKFTVKN